MDSSLDTFNTRRHFSVDNIQYHYFSLPALAESGLTNPLQLPYSIKVLLENLLRFEDGNSVSADDIKVVVDAAQPHQNHEIAFRPARVLMQDFTGVPAVVDLAAMRDAVAARGMDPALINPLSQVDLVIDHSVMVDSFANKNAYKDNMTIEMKRNLERYRFLRWGQTAFDNFRVVPPGTGICHQVNLEYLARVVWSHQAIGHHLAYPDTLMGTDSHTTMINGLGVLGWGVGGIEAEAAMLGQPVSMLIPEVVGFKMTGKLKQGVTATDLVLTVVQMLRKHGVVGKFVEFFGSGLNHLPVADRATIANMAPEYGATCGFFPVDQETLKYLQLSGRDSHTVNRVEAYSRLQGMWRDDNIEPHYSSQLELDFSEVVPSVAGPKRPQDKVALGELKNSITDVITAAGHDAAGARAKVSGSDYDLSDGDVVIAAITSCTNTSNPAVMMAAGLVARKAIEKGLQCKPWVKTSLAPGSKVVTDYLNNAGLQSYLDQLGFNLVGYGCTTCIGNSGPLAEPVEQAIQSGDLSVCSVLSGNRNFEGRIHPRVRANWLASPPLVVAFALAGTTRINLEQDPIGTGKQGEDVYLKDIWPTEHEIQESVALVKSELFTKQYADVFSGDEVWQQLDTPDTTTYQWDEASTYIQKPPYFDLQNETEPAQDIENARILALLGDSITTDHISPAGAIAEDSPAGIYLKQQGVAKADFNSYGSRRGNHQVMMRGTFANIRIRNEMTPDIEGGYSIHIPTGEQLPIYDVAMRYQEQAIPLVVIAGKEYGTGSSRDWAAKGTRLLGIKAVIAESFERIHRSNLLGMGVLPLQFVDSDRNSLQLKGSEFIDIQGIQQLKPGARLTMQIKSEDGKQQSCELLCRIDTENELKYYLSGGILSYVLEQLTEKAARS